MVWTNVHHSYWRAVCSWATIQLIGCIHDYSWMEVWGCWEIVSCQIGVKILKNADRGKGKNVDLCLGGKFCFGISGKG